jgi:cell division protease FtsH
MVYVAALGYTMQVPTEDRFLMTKGELENKIAILLGGRVAEELIFHDISTGARDDLLKATDIAKNMVKTYGMSEVLGQVSLDDGRASTFLPHNQNPSAHEYSEITAREIDAEVRHIIDTQYIRATQILGAQQDVLRAAARVLLQKETISGAELQEMLCPSNGHAPHDDTHIATVH